MPPGWRASGLAEYGYDLPKQTTPHTAQLTHFTAIFHLEEVPEVEPEPEGDEGKEEEATPPVEEEEDVVAKIKGLQKVAEAESQKTAKKGKKPKPQARNVEEELVELESRTAGKL